MKLATTFLLIGLAVFAAAFQRYGGRAQALVNGQPVETVSRSQVETMTRQELETTIPAAAKGINTVTDANGVFTATVSDPTGPFKSTTPVYSAEAVFVGGPTRCQITARSAASVTGICYLSSPQTLPGTLLALGGLVVDPWKSRVPAGTPVMIVGREPTQ